MDLGGGHLYPISDWSVTQYDWGSILSMILPDGFAGNYRLAFIKRGNAESLVGSCYQSYKETGTKTIPIEDLEIVDPEFRALFSLETGQGDCKVSLVQAEY